MGKIGYILSQVKGMDYSRMWETAKTVHRRCGKNTLAALLDIAWCGYKYMAGYMDYLVFEFYTLNSAQRATYITRGVNNRYVKTLNSPEYWDLFNDKIAFNRRFSAYLHRDWLNLQEASLGDFEAFLQGKEKIVAKPVDASCGNGVVIPQGEELKDPAALYARLKANGQVLVEDFVVQHHKIQELYGGSVNTIRMVTIKGHLVFAAIRVGNGKFVDNLNSGGMTTVVDLNTGVIRKPALDKALNLYEKHPISGVSFLGFEIPFFPQCVQLVEQAALEVPQMGYIGWDVAITEEGPLLIEANQFPGHDIYQFQPHLDNGIGLKPAFDRAIQQGWSSPEAQTPA